MMNVPVEIITYYDSKIPVSMSSVYGVTSDVVRCRLNDTWMLLEELKDKWDLTPHEAKFCKLF